MLHIFGALFVSPLRVLHHFPQTLLLLRLVELLRGLTITVRQGSHEQRQSASGSTQIELMFPGGAELIDVSLSYPGSSDLVLPPLQLPG